MLPALLEQGLHRPHIEFSDFHITGLPGGSCIGDLLQGSCGGDGQLTQQIVVEAKQRQDLLPHFLR